MNFLPLEPDIVPTLRFTFFLKVFTIKGYRNFLTVVSLDNDHTTLH